MHTPQAAALLEAFQRFITWLDIHLVLEPNNFVELVVKMFGEGGAVPPASVAGLKCLQEIVGKKMHAEDKLELI